MAATVAVACMAAPAAAQNTTSTAFPVVADVTSGCSIASSSQTTGIAFGTMNFGTKPAVFAGNVSGSVALNGGIVQLRCTQGLVVRVGVDAGAHASGTQRRLWRSGSSQFVPYALYTDAGHTTAVPVSGTVAAATAPASGLISLPVYGVATLPGSGLNPGTYTDTVAVTITW